MPVTINGDGSITGLSVGGLPNGTVDADTLASDAVTTNKIANSAVTPAKSTISGGISDFDTWYLTANTSGNTNPIVNNWSRWTSHGGTGTVTFALLHQEFGLFLLLVIGILIGLVNLRILDHKKEVVIFIFTQQQITTLTFLFTNLVFLCMIVVIPQKDSQG